MSGPWDSSPLPRGLQVAGKLLTAFRANSMRLGFTVWWLRFFNVGIKVMQNLCLPICFTSVFSGSSGDPAIVTPQRPLLSFSCILGDGVFRLTLTLLRLVRRCRAYSGLPAEGLGADSPTAGGSAGGRGPLVSVREVSEAQEMLSPEEARRGRPCGDQRPSLPSECGSFTSCWPQSSSCKVWDLD